MRTTNRAQAAPPFASQAQMSDQPPFIAQVERVHAAVAVVAAIGALALAPQPIWAGVLAGSVVGAANFRALAFLTTRLVAGATSSRHAAIGLLVIKFALLAAVLGAIVTWLEPDGVAFLAGLTLAPVCLVGVVLAGRRHHDKSQGGDAAGPTAPEAAAAPRG